MTMTGLNKTSDIQHHTADWIKHAIQDPSPQTEAAVRWALSRLGEAHVPDVVHAVVLTLTGKKKAAKQARKAAATAVHRAERKLRRADHGHAKAWLAAGLLAAAAAAAALTWRGIAGSAEPKTDQAADPA
jgi:glutathione S-transferase